MWLNFALAAAAFHNIPNGFQLLDYNKIHPAIEFDFSIILHHVVDWVLVSAIIDLKEKETAKIKQ